MLYELVRVSQGLGEDLQADFEGDRQVRIDTQVHTDIGLHVDVQVDIDIQVGRAHVDTRLGDDMELAVAAELVDSKFVEHTERPADIGLLVDGELVGHAEFPAGIGLDTDPGLAAADVLAVDGDFVEHTERSPDIGLLVAAELVDSEFVGHAEFPAGIGIDIGPELAAAEVLAVDTQAVVHLQSQAEFEFDIQGSGVDSQAGVQVVAVPQVHSQAAVSPAV